MNVMNYHQSKQLNTRFRKIFFKIFLSIIFLALLIPVSSTRALTISPPVIEIDADPGSTVKEKIKIVNTTEQPQIFYLSAADFTSGGEAGEPTFLDEEQIPEGYAYSLSPWLKFSDEQIFLPAWEKAEITVTIDVPQGAVPGGHYGVVFFETRAPEVTTEIGVGVASKIGTLVLLRVSGKAVEQGKIIDFNTSALKQRFNRRPITFYTRFENTGNVHLKPYGKIDIYNMLGRLVISLEVNSSGGNVLPDSVRKFEVIWQSSKLAGETTGGFLKRFWQEVKKEKQGFGFGKYRASLSLDFGTEGQTSNANLEFWMFPWRLMLLIVIILALVILLLTVGVKRYNRWILSRVEKR